MQFAINRSVLTFHRFDAAVCIFDRFFGFLRCREFTCRIKDDHDHLNCLLIDDIVFNSVPFQFVLKLRTSKTDLFRAGVDIIINENDTFGAIRTMNNYLKCRLGMEASSASPLFVESEFNTNPLSRETFINYFKTAFNPSWL